MLDKIDPAHRSSAHVDCGFSQAILDKKPSNLLQNTLIGASVLSIVAPKSLSGISALPRFKNLGSIAIGVTILASLILSTKSCEKEQPQQQEADDSWIDWGRVSG